MSHTYYMIKDMFTGFIFSLLMLTFMPASGDFLTFMIETVNPSAIRVHYTEAPKPKVSDFEAQGNFNPDAGLDTSQVERGE